MSQLSDTQVIGLSMPKFTTYENGIQGPCPALEAVSPGRSGSLIPRVFLSALSMGP